MVDTRTRRRMVQALSGAVDSRAGQRRGVEVQERTVRGLQASQGLQGNFWRGAAPAANQLTAQDDDGRTLRFFCLDGNAGLGEGVLA